MQPRSEHWKSFEGRMFGTSVAPFDPSIPTLWPDLLPLGLAFDWDPGCDGGNGGNAETKMYSLLGHGFGWVVWAGVGWLVESLNKKLCGDEMQLAQYHKFCTLDDFPRRRCLFWVALVEIWTCEQWYSWWRKSCTDTGWESVKCCSLYNRGRFQHHHISIISS